MKKTTIVITMLSFLLVVLFSCKPEMEPAHDAGHGEAHKGMLTLSERDKLLAGIKSDSAVVRPISEVTTLVGKTALDERLVNVLTSRLKGRLDKLYVRNPGEFVKKGQLVYAIYSEELLADENDYLLALDQVDQAVAQKEIARQLLEAARNKLSLWTLSKEQIETLETSRDASPLVTFYSLYSGYLVELNVREGEYVDIGTPVLQTAGLQTLWVETQVYSDEVKYLRQSPSLSVEFEAYPGKLFSGEIVFDNPMLEENQKVNLVRLKVDNREGRLRPGMMAYVYLRRNQKKTLVIPKSALLLESGNTQFEFKAADFQFSSLTYDWLVVAGPNGKFKGSGAINGQGDFAFMVTARDGQLAGGGADRFRIRVWEKTAAETVIYDNEPLAETNADASFSIGGGSIVIHGGKDKLVRGTQTAATPAAGLTTFPNPFRDQTMLQLYLAREDRISLQLFDAGGRLVRTLHQGLLPAGWHQWQWDGADDSGRRLAPGVYIFRLNGKQMAEKGRVVLAE